ncbi:MAG: mechanosensitive ion channel domain-containing protein, partial [Limnothrix sp.]
MQTFIRLRRSWLQRIAVIFCLACALSLSLIFQQAIAQPTDAPSPTSAIVIDGRVLFRLGSIDGFTAERRADSVNADLQKILQTTPSDIPIKVRVVQRNDLTTLRVNSRHLLTVTEGDFRRGFSPEEQAEEWAIKMEESLARAQLERRPGYVRSMLWRILLAFSLAIGLYSFVRWLRRRLLRRWTQAANQLSPQERLLQTALQGLQASVWFAFFLYLCELSPKARTARYNTLHFLKNTFNNGLLTVGVKSYSLLDIFQIILFVSILWIAVRAMTAITKRNFLQAAIPDRGLQEAIATLMQFSLTGIGLFIMLQAWGIDLSALAIFASVLGVSLGFGLQSIANNFISGWILLIERPVQVGDFINLGDFMGTVERIGARSTELRTLDQVSVIIPNAELVQTKVMNWSQGHPVSRLHVPLGVAYGSEIEQVHAAIMEAAQSHPKVLRYPQPRLRFLGFGDSSLDFDLLVWLREPRQQFDLKSDLYYLLEANLRHYNIEIPFPQRDLNLKSAQIESIVAALNDGDRPSTRKKDLVQKNDVVEPAIGPSSINLLNSVTDYSAILQNQKSITAEEIDRLVKQMRSPEGLDIG